MAIVINLDVVMAQRKMGLTESLMRIFWLWYCVDLSIFKRASLAAERMQWLSQR